VDFLKMLGWKLHGPAIPAMAQRQRETVVHLLAGKSEKEIAKEMGVSLHTIHGYVKEIHKKLGVNSRAELMARFLPKTVSVIVEPKSSGLP
jgi:DNA-binding CsgD family transcriptional regulator